MKKSDNKGKKSGWNSKVGGSQVSSNSSKGRACAKNCVAKTSRLKPPKKK